MNRENFDTLVVLYEFSSSIKCIIKTLNHTTPLYGVNDDMREHLGKTLPVVGVEKSSSWVKLRCLHGSWTFHYKDLDIHDSHKYKETSVKTSKHKKIKFDIKDLSKLIKGNK